MQMVNCQKLSASKVVWWVKNLPVMQETQVRSLGQEDLLEEETATHSSILPGKSHGQRSKPDRVQSMGSQRVGYARAHMQCGIIGCRRRANAKSSHPGRRQDCLNSPCAMCFFSIMCILIFAGLLEASHELHMGRFE